MRDKVKDTLRRECALPEGAHITVALSGGQDSVVLTELLLSLKTEMGFTLSALHIHHGLRAASDSEELWVREYCRRRALPLTVRHLHLGEHKGQSMEMAARDARYALFAEETKCGRLVATAHHLEDGMETMLINLSRGCGVKGLSSIPYVRDGILRPLLDIPKEDIIAYAKQMGLHWVEDESNADTYYLRNFIRHEILPKLKSREDISFVKGAGATLANLREEAALLDELAAGYRDENRAAVLSTLPRPLLWRVLKGRCAALTRERFAVIAERLGQGSFKEQVAGDLFCTVHRGKLYFEKKLPPIPLTPLEGTLVLEDKTITIEEIHSQFTHSDIDCDTINTKLFVRSKVKGDQFDGTSLSRLMQKKQFKSKDRLVILTDGKRIVYAEGIGVGACHRVGPTTKKALRITIK